jgi:hypothetical protein
MMPQSMIIPREWLVEAGLLNFQLAPLQLAFRCEDVHSLVALADIEAPLRNSGYPLDANGFNRGRMMSILTGILNDVPLPAIYIERADPYQRAYRVRQGVHRYHASLTLGFSHIPTEVIPRLD